MIRTEDEMRYPPELHGRVGFKNFAWTIEAISEWEHVWNALWACGVKWEWQNTDRYARPRGEHFDLFTVHDDAAKLDMAFPLPAVHTIKELNDWLLDAHLDDNKASEATNLIRKWIKDYV
ncbi:MAG TPA: hypothetical protein EYN67_04405 [Flavobacteriales bacterium]|nr:hypothetical protein [Flavobacteriales bacterium]